MAAKRGSRSRPPVSPDPPASVDAPSAAERPNATSASTARIQTVSGEQPAVAALSGQIRIRDAAVHNLQHLSIDIPLGRWTSVLGVSGSGKSSLVFDTLVVESQRRYLESLSPAIRRRLQTFERPAVESIDNLPLAIALRQTHTDRLHRPRSVASLLELPALFQEATRVCGRLICPTCQTPITPASLSSAVRWFAAQPVGERFILASPLTRLPESTLAAPSSPTSPESAAASTPLPPIPLAEIAAEYQARGFARLLVGGRLCDWSTAVSLTPPSPSMPSPTDEPALVIDRVTAGQTSLDRWTEAIEAAYREGFGRCLVYAAKSHPLDAVDSRARTDFELVARWDRRSRCGKCLRELPPLASRDWDSWSRRGHNSVTSHERAFDRGTPTSTPHPASESVPDSLQAEQLFQRSANWWWTTPLADTLKHLNQQPASTLDHADDSHLAALEIVLREIRRRLELLVRLGLGPIPLGRLSSQLADGELRRVRLAGVLAVPLTQALYVLDEPSAGLAIPDQQLLVTLIRELVDVGNTVITVDHQWPLIAAADQVIELGPGAGSQGGLIVSAGPMTSDLRAALHAKYVAASESIERAPTTAATAKQATSTQETAHPGIKNRAAALWTLRDVNRPPLRLDEVAFPNGQFTVVVGASGSGKTTLLINSLQPALQALLPNSASSDSSSAGSAPDLRGGHPGVVIAPKPTASTAAAVSDIDVLVIDQSPLSRSSRTLLAHVLGVYDDLRAVFTETTVAKDRQLKPGDFSLFNPQGLRCGECAGRGTLEIRIPGLSAMTVACPSCHGTRFRREIWEVPFRGLSLPEVLALPIPDALAFFRNHPAIQRRLVGLETLGLEHLQLGRATATLSGGEVQRLRLALSLSRKPAGQTIVIADEPTRGLHPADSRKVLDAFRQLVNVGQTVIVADHDPQFWRAADWLIELGPGMLHSGPRSAVLANPASLTAAWLLALESHQPLSQ